MYYNKWDEEQKENTVNNGHTEIGNYVCASVHCSNTHNFCVKYWFELITTADDNKETKHTQTHTFCSSLSLCVHQLVTVI